MKMMTVIRQKLSRPTTTPFAAALAAALLCSAGCTTTRTANAQEADGAETLVEHELERHEAQWPELQEQSAEAEGIPDVDEVFEPTPKRPDRAALTPTLAPVKRVYFDYDAFYVERGERAELRRVVRWLEENPDVQLVLEGHTDVRGTTAYNETLGKKRAEQIKARLVGMGIEADRITTISFGEFAPEVSSADSEAEHQLNRRVVFDYVPVREALTAR